MTPWAIRADALPHWPDAENMDASVLDNLLAVATEQCAAFAPALAEGAEVPARYRLAVVLQARDLHRAGLGEDDGSIGADGFAIAPRSMSVHVLQLLRPRLGRPRFGRRQEATS